MSLDRSRITSCFGDCRAEASVEYAALLGAAALLISLVAAPIVSLVQSGFIPLFSAFTSSSAGPLCMPSVTCDPAS